MKWNKDVVATPAWLMVDRAVAMITGSGIAIGLHTVITAWLAM